MIIQTNVRCHRSSRSVIPSREDDEGPHNRGLTFKRARVPVRMLAGSLACARDDSKKSALPRLSVDQFRELFEKVTRVVRPGRCLRMILHAKNRQFLMTHSFDRVVVQVDVRYFDLFRQ